MRQISNLPLWIGHAGDLRDPRRILATGIEAVVELADSEPLAVLPRELIRCRFPLSDGGTNPPWLLRLAVQTVVQLLKAKVPTLVCCSGGMSRSLCIAAGGLSLHVGCSLDEALNLVAEQGPVDVTPGLLLQLINAMKGD